MPKTIFIKDYNTEIEIPDDADMAQVQSALQKQFPPKDGDATPVSSASSQYRQGGFWSSLAKPSTYRPALEIGGALAGAAIASPGNIVAPGLASLAGSGIGYASGRQLANALEELSGERRTATLPEALASTAAAIPEGAAMEAGGALLGKGLQAALGVVAKQAPKIWERIAKIPPRSVPKVKRDAAVKTALDYEIVPNEKGLVKLRGMIEDTNQRIAEEIDSAMDLTTRAENLNRKSGVKEFSEGKIPVNKLSERLDEIKQWAKNSFENPIPAIDMVNKAKAEIMAARGKDLTVAEAQKLKQGIYKRLTESGYAPGADDTMTINRKISKTFARALKEEIVERLPILQTLNNKDSALIGLQNILEKSVNRIRNRDFLGLPELLGSGIGTIGGVLDDKSLGGAGKGAVTGALAMRILRSPAVMGRIAFAMNKAAKFKGAPLLTRGAAFLPAKEASETGGLSEKLVPIISKLDPASQSEASVTMPHAEKLSTPMQRAMQAYLGGDYDTTIMELRDAIKQNPSKAPALRNQLSQVLYEKNAFNERLTKRGGI